jgi:hypothetical protein
VYRAIAMEFDPFSLGFTLLRPSFPQTSPAKVGPGYYDATATVTGAIGKKNGKAANWGASKAKRGMDYKSLAPGPGTYNPSQVRMCGCVGVGAGMLARARSQEEQGIGLFLPLIP